MQNGDFWFSPQNLILKFGAFWLELHVLYSYNTLEMSSKNTWFWQFFLKKIISRAEFDELCYFGTQNPWNVGKNCKRIGLNSKNLSIKLIITDDIFSHCVRLNVLRVTHWPLEFFWLDWAWLVLKLWFVRTIRVEIIWLHMVIILPLYVE